MWFHLPIHREGPTDNCDPKTVDVFLYIQKFYVGDKRSERKSMPFSVHRKRFKILFWIQNKFVFTVSDLVWVVKCSMTFGN